MCFHQRAFRIIINVDLYLFITIRGQALFEKRQQASKIKRRVGKSYISAYFRTILMCNEQGFNVHCGKCRLQVLKGVCLLQCVFRLHESAGELPSLREQGAGSRHHEDQTVREEDQNRFLFS